VVELASLKSIFLWLDETQAYYGACQQLVASIPVIGKNAHDARFVAAMTVHGLTHLLTFNTQDFSAIPRNNGGKPRRCPAASTTCTRSQDTVTP
jgi:hypothetical protein